MLNCPFLTPKPVVDVRNPKDQDWLLWWLDVYEIRFSELDVVGWQIQGRPHTDLQAIALGVKKRRPEGFDEWSHAAPWVERPSAQNRPQPVRRRPGHGWRDLARSQGIDAGSRAPAGARPPRPTAAAGATTTGGAPTGTGTGSVKGSSRPPW